MEHEELISLLSSKYNLVPVKIVENHGDEIYIKAMHGNFHEFCLALHQELKSPVMSMFLCDAGDNYVIYCSFLGIKFNKWFFVTMDIRKDELKFDSIAKEIYSANLFEREIKEMFGIDLIGNPDSRRLRLHDEVWPRGYYPLRKDFEAPKEKGHTGEFDFTKVEGEGIFEIPVGPVHAGIIAPGHFRFSVAGEPIINLEIRLGFKHRGIEKLMENKSPHEALKLSECVAGDSNIAHSWAFLSAIEKISGINVPPRALQIRSILLELERMYDHISSIGGIALDVGFSHPAALASIIKESILQLNDRLTGSRYLKGVNTFGGVKVDIDHAKKTLIIDEFKEILGDFKELKNILSSSVSFLDRVDTTGYLNRKLAEDFGVLGLCGRASGIDIDLRRDMPGIYRDIEFKVAVSQSGDVFARLNTRIQEFEVSSAIILKLLGKMEPGEILTREINIKEGFGLGYAEGCRGPVLYWISLNEAGRIERCKIVDPSFRNWQGLSYAVHDNIVPDFPVCNKSFDLSYSGSDL